MQRPYLLRYGVFGGSFNPVHVGHVELAAGLIAAGVLDRLIIIPAHLSPFKQDMQLLPAPLRLEMLRAAMGRIPGVSVLDLELRRPAPSYMVDTLAELAAVYPRAQPQLVLGMDAFRGFAGWRGGQRILARASILLVARVEQQVAANAGMTGAGDAPDMPVAEDPGTGGAQVWAQFLPEPWARCCRAVSERLLVDDSGRTVVTEVPLRVRGVSSTQIRDGGLLDCIPPAARALLRPYLAQVASGSRSWSAGSDF